MRRVGGQQVPVFSADHHVVVFDHRGFGRSVCPPEQQSAVHYEADVTAVMDAAGIDRAVIVCQSMGGWTGVRTAVYRTDRVHGVLLGNTPGAVRTEVTVENRRKMTERLAEAGGLIQPGLQPGVRRAKSRWRGAVSADLGIQHPSTTEHTRRRSVRGTRRRKGLGRSVPGPLERP